MLSCHACCVLSRVSCNGDSLLLSSYLFRIGRIENPSCSACGNSSQNTSHFILHCPATESLRHSLFGDFLSLYNLWSRPRSVDRLLGLYGLPPCPTPSEGIGYSTTTRLPQKRLKSRRPFVPAAWKLFNNLSELGISVVQWTNYRWSEKYSKAHLHCMFLFPGLVLDPLKLVCSEHLELGSIACGLALGVLICPCTNGSCSLFEWRVWCHQTNHRPRYLGMLHKSGTSKGGRSDGFR